MRADLRPFEEEIARTKRELNELFRRESLAARQGNSGEANRTHLALLQKELENVRTIARYLEPISPPVARDLERWHAQMQSRFEQLRSRGNPAEVQQWVARELVPHLRRSEQLAHLLATSIRSGAKKAAAPFGWPVAVDKALRGAAAGERGGRRPRSP